MISKTTSFKTSDGTIHESIEAAQQHELESFLKSALGDFSDHSTGVASALITHREKVIDLLTMKATSKPRARKVNGGTKKRSSANQPAPTGSPNLQ